MAEQQGNAGQPGDPKNEPMMDVARGDKAVSRHLRDSLKVLRDKSEDPDFRRQIDDILNGRVSLREAAFTGTFERGIAAPFEAGMRRYQEFSEQEVDQMAAQGEQAFERLTEELEEEERLR